MFTEINDYIVNWGIANSSNKASQALIKHQGERGAVSKPVGVYLKEIYTKCVDDTSNVNGSIFEYLVAATLKKLYLAPFALKACLEPIPNIEWDIVFWDERSNQPIALFLTTSIRERHHLADAQAFRLKSSFPNARMYLLTMHAVEAAKLSKHPFESLDGCFYVGSEQFDSLIESLEGLARGPLSVGNLERKITSGKLIK